MQVGLQLIPHQEMLVVLRVPIIFLEHHKVTVEAVEVVVLM